MGDFSCMICSDKIAARAIDEETAKGMSGAGIARLMTLRGFAVTAPTVIQHQKHAVPVAPPNAKLQKRDAAIFIRDKLMDRVEAMDAMPSIPIEGGGELGFDITDKDLQPALKTMLTAQRDLDRRVSKTGDQKTAIAMAMILSGAIGGRGAIPESLLIDDGKTIEGEFEEVDVQSSE